MLEWFDYRRTMKEGPNIASVAALIGDPARANMLTALMSGKALTVSELAGEAGVTLQTASSHLAKLDQGGLLRPRKQGRHKYFALANDDVATVLEGLMGLAAGTGHLRTQPGPRDAALRHARVCYNHLAGERGTALYDRLLAAGHLQRGVERPFLTESGTQFFRNFGIDLDGLNARKSPLCRECLDWSERRAHLAGSLGRALFSRFDALGWASSDPSTRIVTFSQKGERGFAALLI